MVSTQCQALSETQVLDNFPIGVFLFLEVQKFGGGFAICLGKTVSSGARQFLFNLYQMDYGKKKIIENTFWFNTLTFDENMDLFQGKEKTISGPWYHFTSKLLWQRQRYSNCSGMFLLCKWIVFMF